MELPLETAGLIDSALDRARDDDNAVELGNESFAARQADALVTIAKDYLAGGSGRADSAPDYQVTVHVDESALAEGNGRAGLPIESVKRIACDADKVQIVENRKGEPLSVGRKSRVVPKGIERAVRARDMLDDDIGERCQNPPRGGLLSAVEKLVNEPPPPQYIH